MIAKNAAMRNVCTESKRQANRHCSGNTRQLILLHVPNAPKAMIKPSLITAACFVYVRIGT